MNTLKSCLRSPNQHLCIATMSAAATLYPLLMQSKSRSASQDSLILRQFLSIFLPSSGIIEKLGDAKEKVREKAQQVLLTIGSSIIQAGGLSTLPLSKGKDTKVIESPFQLFERFIREQGLGSKNWRVKEQVSISPFIWSILSRRFLDYPVFSTTAAHACFFSLETLSSRISRFLGEQ